MSETLIDVSDLNSLRKLFEEALTEGEEWGMFLELRGKGNLNYYRADIDSSVAKANVLSKDPVSAILKAVLIGLGIDDERLD